MFYLYNNKQFLVKRFIISVLLIFIYIKIILFIFNFTDSNVPKVTKFVPFLLDCQNVTFS